jgi:hypothetical protein
MFENRADLLWGQMGTFQYRALALGKMVVASAAIDHVDALPLPTPAPEAQVALASDAVVGTLGILAAEVLDRVHGPLRGHFSRPFLQHLSARRALRLKG